jgi:hypothetical protein
MRRFKGAFNLAMESYSRLQDIRDKTNRLYLYITTVLTQYNQFRIFEIIDFVKKNMQIDGHNICIVRGKTKEPMDAPGAEMYNNAINYVSRNSRINLNNIVSRMMYQANLACLKNNGFHIPCVAGRKMFVITEDGSIRICEMPGIGEDIGNLRDFGYNIDRIMSSARADELRKDIKKKRCICTFECANMCNVIFNPLYIPLLLYRIWRNR